MTNNCNEELYFVVLKLMLGMKMYRIDKYMNCKVILLEIIFLTTNNGSED